LQAEVRRLSARARYTYNHALERSTVLDVGCGTRKAEPGALGIDRSPGPDFVWDLDHYPWPLEADGFERIHMSHIIEHVQDVMAMMAEVPGRQFENGGGVARSSGVGCDGG
jgi:hypothetical protein